jgi:hypothetical protein
MKEIDGVYWFVSQTAGLQLMFVRTFLMQHINGDV